MCLLLSLTTTVSLNLALSAGNHKRRRGPLPPHVHNRSDELASLGGAEVAGGPCVDAAPGLRGSKPALPGVQLLCDGVGKLLVEREFQLPAQ